MSDEEPTKEERIALIVKELPGRELTAYKRFRRSGQADVSPDKAEEFFALFCRGTSCPDISKLFPGFTLDQVVGCRVMYEWDARRAEARQNIQLEVPGSTATTQLETQEFLSNLLHASHKRFNDSMKMYIATGDMAHLKGVPIPTSMKDLSSLVELYMKVAGTDVRRVDVNVQGTVNHTATKPRLAAAEAASIVDSLLEEEEAIDVEVSPVVPKSIAAIPETQDECNAKMVETLVKSGMPRDGAVSMVASLEADSAALAAKYADAATRVADKAKGGPN